MPITVVQTQQVENVKKDTLDPKITINQLDLIGIYRLPIQQEWDTHFSQVHVKYSPRQTMFWVKKAHHNIFKNTKIIQCIFSSYTGVNLEIKDRKIVRKIPR